MRPLRASPRTARPAATRSVAHSDYGSVDVLAHEHRGGHLGGDRRDGDDRASQATVTTRYAQPLQARSLTRTATRFRARPSRSARSCRRRARRRRGAASVPRRRAQAASDERNRARDLAAASPPTRRAGQVHGHRRPPQVSQHVATYTLDNLAGSRRRSQSPAGRGQRARGGALCGRLSVMRARRSGTPSRARPSASSSLPPGSSAAARRRRFVGGASQATATTERAGIASSPRARRQQDSGILRRDGDDDRTTGVTFALHNRRRACPRPIVAGAAASESTTHRDAFPGAPRRHRHRRVRESRRRRGS